MKVSLITKSVAALTLSVSLTAQHSHGGGEHYVREPVPLAGPGNFQEYAIASDHELSVIVFKDELDQVVRAVTSDGRGIGSTWTNPTAISAPTSDARRVTRESIHVIGDRAIALWSESVGVGASRLFANVYSGGSWRGPAPLNDLGLATGASLTSWSAVAKPGLNGAVTVALAFATASTRGPELWLSVSPNGGDGFLPPMTIAADGARPGGSSGAIGGTAVDLQLGEVHLAWTDDRTGSLVPYYRRGIVDWFGRTWFTAPLGTDETPLSAVGAVVGAPVLQVNGERRWSGSDQKYVGVAWRADVAPGANSTLFVSSSRDSGASFSMPLVVAHTGRPDVVVSSFDFEIVGDTFAVIWQDNAEDDPLTGIITVPSPAESHVWRAESDDGASFDPAAGAIVQRMSAQADADHEGRAPSIARSVGTPDGSMVVFLEDTDDGAEVYSTFSDQEYGGAWHAEDYPVASEAQRKSGPNTGVRAPQVAYNARYYNFMMVWAQESVASSGNYELIVGGYRPPQVGIEGWGEGAATLEFELEHLPFEDTFTVVLVALSASELGAGTLALPDGRTTGLIPDGFTIAALSDLFVFFSAPNDPIAEGAATIPLPIPPLPIGLQLHFAGLTWGPFGEFHVLTDVFSAAYGTEMP